MLIYMNEYLEVPSLYELCIDEMIRKNGSDDICETLLQNMPNLIKNDIDWFTKELRKLSTNIRKASKQMDLTNALVKEVETFQGTTMSAVLEKLRRNDWVNNGS